MVTLPKGNIQNHPLRLRMIRIYLLAILACTLLLFSISLVSLVQQQHMVRDHSEANLGLLARNAAAELDRKIQILADAALSRSEINSLNYRAGDESIPDHARNLRLRFEAMSRKHPIAENFLILNEEGRAILRQKEDSIGQDLESGHTMAGAELNLLRPNQIGFVSIWNGEKTDQIYYAALPEDKTAEKVALGFVVSLPWVQEQLLPEYSRQLNPYGSELWLEDVVQAEADGDIYVPLPTLGWKLKIPEASIHNRNVLARQELWFIGAAALMFLSILALGIVLLIRVSWHIRWYQVRSDFVSGISHELKTPLSLIRLYSETLAGDDQDFAPDERKSFIRIIARESERLSRLIDNVLDFSRIEQGKKASPLTEGDIADVVAQTVEDYADYLNLRGFSVKTGIQPNVPPIKFNREGVSQAVLNLMDNARKYSGGSRLIRVHLWLMDGHIVVEIQDYGIGIPLEEKDKIFDPFYRVTNQSEKGGCGLGLYLVAQVMQNHKGRIEVESELGKGSRFRLYFPVVQTG